MGIYDELANLKPDTTSSKTGRKTIELKKPAQKKTKRAVDQPIDKSTDQSIDQSTDIDLLGPVVDRPRAFYITQKIDRWLDEAVRYLREKGMHKADRSVLVNALLHDVDLYKTNHLDDLRRRLLAHLTNKSLKRVQSTD